MSDSIDLGRRSVPAGFESDPQKAAFAAADAHGTVDDRVVFDDISIVIPTNRPDNYTSESAPEYADIVVRTDDGLNVARNRGVKEADNDWIVLVDDDITFPTRLTAILVDSMHERHLVGIEDFWPMRWVLGRYMIFHRSLWQAAGGFDESRPHGGDTDFAIRCEDVGARVLRLPRKIVPHHDETSNFTTAAHAEWLWYLTKNHPLTVAPIAIKLVGRKLGFLESNEFDYPDGFKSQANVPPMRDD
ncbi:glycosyltransferase family 2 protein [Halarchaeum acidiphilum]|uniref:glycosyltransferase family 2 protein n=1 Tax=Halarchaeum acidiphilum TaxID=489138 RepID=UPI0009DB87C7|nr:glycosyltransferase [Halarchaeum acidiphilum]